MLTRLLIMASFTLGTLGQASSAENPEIVFVVDIQSEGKYVWHDEFGIWVSPAAAKVLSKDPGFDYKESGNLVCSSAPIDSSNAEHLSLYLEFLNETVAVSIADSSAKKVGKPSALRKTRGRKKTGKVCKPSFAKETENVFAGNHRDLKFIFRPSEDAVDGKETIRIEGSPLRRLPNSPLRSGKQPMGPPVPGTPGADDKRKHWREISEAVPANEADGDQELADELAENRGMRHLLARQPAMYARVAARKLARVLDFSDDENTLPGG